jgi:hypothetical protein
MQRCSLRKNVLLCCALLIAHKPFDWPAELGDKTDRILNERTSQVVLRPQPSIYKVLAVVVCDCTCPARRPLLLLLWRLLLHLGATHGALHATRWHALIYVPHALLHWALIIAKLLLLLLHACRQQQCTKAEQWGVRAKQGPKHSGVQGSPSRPPAAVRCPQHVLWSKSTDIVSKNCTPSPTPATQNTADLLPVLLQVRGYQHSCALLSLLLQVHPPPHSPTPHPTTTPPPPAAAHPLPGSPGPSIMGPPCIMPGPGIIPGPPIPGPGTIPGPPMPPPAMTGSNTGGLQVHCCRDLPHTTPAEEGSRLPIGHEWSAQYVSLLFGLPALCVHAHPL